MGAGPALKPEQFADFRWRLNNLYWITDEKGQRVPFRLNWAQETLLDEMHYLNVILKARQLGFTTLIQLFMLDQCMFVPDIRAGTIAHTREDAEAFFRDKVKFPYDNLPEGLRAHNAATEDSARKLSFANNSSIRVGTSLRSGTFQYLHVSEFGKICAQYPDKAREIKTGAFNTVHPGQVIWVESTAEGQEGEFYEMCRRAQGQKEHTQLDFKFHFFPWWRHPGYRMDADVVVPQQLVEYFTKLNTQHGILLTDEQKAWYAKKAVQQGEDMKREFPSTWTEAFEAAIEGAYFAQQIGQARNEGRIGFFPLEPGVPVNTFWDIGRNDQTAIWFHQRCGRENRFVDFYQNSGEGVAHYARILQEKADQRGFVYGQHYGPHDLAVTDWIAANGQTREQIAAGYGIVFEIVPRVQDKMDSIEAARQALPTCTFDEKHCSEGIAMLSAYRKEWDDKRGVWKDQPRHDTASDAADAFQTFAWGYDAEDEEDMPYDDLLMEMGRSSVSGY